MWKTLHHYAHAILLRAELMLELRRARRQGMRLPARIASRVWRDPGNLEDRVRLLRFLRPDEPLLIIDVGGNDGGWCETTLEFFPEARVLAFEPTAEQHRRYRDRFAGASHVELHQVALSDRAGSAEINVARDSGRTSLLEYSDSQKELGIEFRGTEEVTLDVLDHYDLSAYGGSRIFLKVDVQGHEVEALRGAAKSLDRIDVVLVECSFADEYRDTLPSFAHVCRLLLEHDLYPIVFRDYGRRLSPYAWERDVIFVKRPLLDGIWGW